MKTKLVLFLAAFTLYSPLYAESTWSQPSHGGLKASQIREQQIRSAISDKEPWLGLLGDSGITGAATSEDLHTTWWSLTKLVGSFLGETTRTVQIAKTERVPNPSQFGLSGTQLSPLVRVLYSMEEFDLAKKDSKVADLNLQVKGSLRLDIPEYSFEYLAGRGAGFPAERIVLVAQDGNRVGTIFRQMKRFGEISETLPSHIVISYSANDICGTELDGSVEAFAEDFRNIIRRELRLSIENLKPHSRLGTHVVVMAPLDVPQLLTNESLFSQRISFQGVKNKTCGDVRHQRAAETPAGVKMQETLIAMCPAVIKTSPNDKARVQKIRDFQEAQIQVWKEVLAETSAPNWTFEFNEGSRKPQYRAGDLANDCFHPGPGAHSLIANELMPSLKIK